MCPASISRPTNWPLPFLVPKSGRYQQTKLANVVFTYALHDRLQAAGSKIKSLCAHPGVAQTQLSTQTMKQGGAKARKTT